LLTSRAISTILAACRRRHGSRSGRFWHLEMDPSLLGSQCNENTAARWAASPTARGSRGDPTSSCTCSRAFSQAGQVRAGHQGETDRDRHLHAWHIPHLQTPTQGCRVPPPSSSSSLPAAQTTNLPSWMLLFCWRFVSHIPDVTSPRHRNSEMDLMSLCFLQLRKISKKRSLEHPEETAGLSTPATVPAGGQIQLQEGPAGWLTANAEHQRPGDDMPKLHKNASVLPRACSLPHSSRDTVGDIPLCLALP